MPDTILLCANAHKDVGLKAAQYARQLLTDSGIACKIVPFLSGGLEDTWDADLPVYRLEDVLPEAKLVVTFGGDGTILQISRYLAGTGIPILGYNMGTKGFLAELERSEIHQLPAAARGEYTLQSRMMLDITLRREGKTIYSACALNEAVVRSTVSVVQFEAFGDGREITSFSGDGIIVASPTGSTAYNISAGGPLVEPDSDCLILSPICPFRLAARSVVLTPERHVTVRTDNQGSKQVLLSVDGDPVEFLDGDELSVSRSEKRLLMAHLNNRTFYDIVFEKLNDKN